MVSWTPPPSIMNLITAIQELNPRLCQNYDNDRSGFPVIDTEIPTIHGAVVNRLHKRKPDEHRSLWGVYLHLSSD